MKYVNPVKKAVTRYRRESKRFNPYPVLLCHMLINIRSRFSDWQTDNVTLLDLILSLQKNQDREYGVKRAILTKYGSDCFSQKQWRRYYGKRTVFENGQWKSAYTEVDELPF